MALQVLEALGESAIGDALPAIEAALRDPSVQVRALSARVLGGAGPGAAEEAVTLLATAVDDRSIRDAAVDALGRLGPAARSAVPVLVRVLEDSTERTAQRRRAAAALRRIGAEGAQVDDGLRALAAGTRPAD